MPFFVFVVVVLLLFLPVFQRITPDSAKAAGTRLPAQGDAVLGQGVC